MTLQRQSLPFIFPLSHLHIPGNDLPEEVLSVRWQGNSYVTGLITRLVHTGSKQMKAKKSERKV